MPILVFSLNPSSRLNYVLKVFFEHFCPHAYTLTYDKNEYLRLDGLKINYSKAPVAPNEVWISPENLLFQSSLQLYPVQVIWEEGCPWLTFGEKKEGILPADPFASAFYLLSRYEEYLPFTPDQHGRFTAAQSLSKREGFLQMPLVQRWLYALLNALQTNNPGFSWQAPAYIFAPTYDVDMPWAFSYRPWWKQWGGAVRDLLWGKKQGWQDRRRAMRQALEDPFYTFPQLHAWHREYDLTPRFFMLMGDASLYDTNPSPNLPAQQSLIRELAGLYPLGIHPSYLSNDEPSRILMEKKRLEAISGQKITHSRQHFLKLHLPSTYRRLIEAGIKVDYSMGYADDTGFRAGTNIPFPWYDLEREICTDLLIYPFAAMDVTLQQYLALDAEAAFQRLQALYKEVSKWGGPFCLLWHNSSFYPEDGWEGWKDMYAQLLEMASVGSIERPDWERG